jgi:hypothetical protein
MTPVLRESDSRVEQCCDIVPRHAMCGDSARRPGTIPLTVHDPPFNPDWRLIPPLGIASVKAAGGRLRLPFAEQLVGPMLGLSPRADDAAPEASPLRLVDAFAVRTTHDR